MKIVTKQLCIRLNVNFTFQFVSNKQADSESTAVQQWSSLRKQEEPDLKSSWHHIVGSYIIIL